MAVDYYITPFGRTLRDPFVALVTWAAENSGSINQAQQTYDQMRP